MQLQVRLDTKELAKLRELTGKSRVAGAKALTFTAKDAQLRLKMEVPGIFHMRNDWVPKGIRIRPATSGRMVAVVGSLDKYMERHVVGKGKRPGHALSIRSKRDSRGRLASGGILIQPYGSIGQVPKHQVVRRKLSRMDTNKRKTFQIVGKGGAKVLIVRRTSKKRYPLQTVAILDADAPQNVMWDFAGTVRATVQARFAGHFYRAIAKV